jgi:hypothetical protein
MSEWHEKKWVHLVICTYKTDNSVFYEEVCIGSIAFHWAYQ